MKLLSMNKNCGFAYIPVFIAIAVVLGLGGYLVISGQRTTLLAPSAENQENTEEPGVIINSGEKSEKPKVTAEVEKKKSSAPQTEASHSQNPFLDITSDLKSKLPLQQKTGLFGQLCEGSGAIKLSTFPIATENIELIQPMGRVQDSHVTPTDHQYIIPKGTTGGSLVTDNPRKYEIRAPADGFIIQIELFKETVEEQYRKDPYQNNYLVLFEHSCDFYTRLIHIDTLSERVLGSFSFRNPESQHPYATARIPVKKGEVIGTVGSHSVDFQVMDTNSRNKNLISPDNIDFFSSYTVDTFDYLAEPLRGELLKKNLTTALPLGGKIGYDIDGKISGNWFLQGRDKNRPDYWVNNLSIVYDHLDPTQIRISFGDFAGYPKAFGVKGNIPDPANIVVSSGIVKYELVTFDYYGNGGKWDTIHLAQNLVARNNSEIAGTALFELLEPKKLKVEVFPGKTLAEVEGFTTAVKTYER